MEQTPPEKKPKKRGRKPKNNIIVNDNPVFKSGIEDLVIHLKPSTSDKSINILPGYEKIETNIESDNNSCLCWNCCHGFLPRKYGIPLKYSDSIFYTYGDFCSLECVARYIFDNFKNKDLWDKYSLLNLFYNIIHTTKGKQVYIPPNRLILKSFGGTIDIDEYRSIKDSFDIHIPPVIEINHTINKHTARIKQTTNKTELKLYRKSSLTNKNNIFSTMNIKN
jgi:hypothetical protein